MGNIREAALEKIWNGPKYIEFRNKLRELNLLPMCMKCCKLVHRYWSHLPTIRPKKRKKKNRVAFIMPQFPRYDETFISRELLELKNNNLDLYIFSLQHNKDTIIHKEITPLINRTININFLMSFALINAQLYFIVRHPLRYLLAFISIFKQLYKSPRYLFKAIAIFPKSVYFAKLSRTLGISHIHAQWATTPTVSAMVINRLTDISFSFTGHAHDIYVDTVGLKEKIEKASFVTTCTADNKRYLLNLLNNHSLQEKLSNKIIVSYHGVDLEKFNGKTRVQNLRDRHFRILSVGSLLPCKGFDVLIDACLILKDKGIDFECIIAGGGPLEKSLKLKIKNAKLEDCVKLTGYITQEELIPLYKQADVFAIPVNLDIHWGIPNVLLESMACGVPIITTHLPSLPELIDDGKNGLIIPEKDPEETANAIKLLCENRDLRSALGRNAKKVIQEKFDVKKNVTKIKRIFEEILEAKKCLGCNSFNTKVLINGRVSFSPNVLICQNCGLIFLEGTNNEGIYRKESNTYWVDKGGQKNIYSDIKISEGFNKEFINRISKIDSLATEKGNLLDVGCGIGQFLEVAQKDGWHCFGLDVSPEAVSYVKEKLKINAVCRNLKDNGFNNNYFDVVTMWDVIEHLQNPIEDLKVVNRILKPNGILAIKTPNEGSLFKEIGKFIHRFSLGTLSFHLKYLYYSPHYYYFYPQTLSRILNDTGFKVIGVEFDQTNLGFARKKIKRHYGKFFSSKIISAGLGLFYGLAALLKKQNKMVVYAQKV